MKMKSQSPRQAGVALIIVLGFLVIISALAVAFFSSVTTELKATRNFASGVTTRQLAESAVNVVMGQVRDASSQPNMAWASQPGMIRVYDTSAPNAFYKLYSSDNMVVTSTDISSFDPGNDFEPAWNSQPAVWTDLNSPVLIPDPAGGATTLPRFPIIDPRAYAVASLPADGPYFNYANDPGNNKWQRNIEGFWYGKDPNRAIAKTPAGIVPPKDDGSDSDSQRLPMPTRWIYVLQDGTLTTPDATLSTGTTAQ